MPMCALSINGKVWQVLGQEKRESSIVIPVVLSGNRLDDMNFVFDYARTNRNGVDEYRLAQVRRVQL